MQDAGYEEVVAVFGSVIASIDDLDEAEKARYRALYCGLCLALRDRCGQRARFALTYDLTFLMALLSALYEPAERKGETRCPVHPTKPQTWTRSVYTDYAADLSVLFAYHKCKDDWRDDGSRVAWGYARLLEKPYGAAKEAWPRQCAAIEQSLARIDAIEHAGGDEPDAAANCFGVALGEAFVVHDDMWAPTLRQMGAQLGRFVYAVDAAVDLEEDRASGSYNPFSSMDVTPDDLRELLCALIAGAADAFERLPIEQDIHLLRSVLYAGVWQPFNKKYSKDAGRDE